MRKYVVLLMMLLAGCAGQPSMEDAAQGANFNPLDAAKTRISLGLTYLKNGNYTQAKFNLDKALQYAPRLADAHYSMAYYYQMVGEMTLADQAYRDAMSLEPKNPDILNSYGAFLCQQGQYEKAKQYFLDAIATQNYIRTAESYENLALCSQSQGQLADAQHYLRMALNHQPGRAKSLMLLAELQAGEQDWLGAKNTLAKYEKLARVTPESLLLAAKVEKGLGNLKGMQDYGRMLLQLYPEHQANQAYRLMQYDAPPAPASLTKDMPKKITAAEVPRAEDATAGTAGTAVAPTTEAPEQDRPLEQAVLADVPSMADANQQTDDDVVFHTVLKDQNLYRISLIYNVRMDKLIEWNGLKDASSIYAGQQLRVRAPE